MSQDRQGQWAMRRWFFGMTVPGLVFMAMACGAGAVAVRPTPVHASDIPQWLRGPPDVERRQGMCGVYDWFFVQADRQTQGLASDDELASRRVINIANKIVDRHRVSPVDSYEARIRYLVFGDAGPFHFEFRIRAEELERNLDEGCEG